MNPQFQIQTHRIGCCWAKVPLHPHPWISTLQGPPLFEVGLGNWPTMKVGDDESLLGYIIVAMNLHTSGIYQSVMQPTSLSCMITTWIQFYAAISMVRVKFHGNSSTVPNPKRSLNLHKQLAESSDPFRIDLNFPEGLHFPALVGELWRFSGECWRILSQE